MSATAAFEPIHTEALVVEKVGGAFKLLNVTWNCMRDDEVLVEILYTGLCHTDIAVQQGRLPYGSYPVILGHEGAGIVRRIGTSVKYKGLKVSDTVLLSFTSCNACTPCSKGDIASCTRFSETNFSGTSANAGSSPTSSSLEGQNIRAQFFGQSALCRMAVVKEGSVIKCDLTNKEMSIMAPLGCGYQTGAGTVFNVLKPTAADTIAILGIGGVGCAALMAAKVAKAKRIIAVDFVPSKLKLAMCLGATDVINTIETPNITGAIRSVLPEGVDGIVDTTGLPSLIEGGIMALAQQGNIALLGVAPPGSHLEIDPWIIMSRCLKVSGVIEGHSVPGEMIPKLIRLYRQGKFPIDMLTKLYPVSDIDEAVADMKTGRVVKPVLFWGRPGESI